MNNTKTLSIVKKVYYTYIGVCTISGFYYGCKSSINNLKSNYTIIDKFEKSAEILKIKVCESLSFYRDKNNFSDYNHQKLFIIDILLSSIISETIITSKFFFTFSIILQPLSPNSK